MKNPTLIPANEYLAKFGVINFLRYRVWKSFVTSLWFTTKVTMDGQMITVTTSPTWLYNIRHNIEKMICKQFDHKMKRHTPAWSECTRCGKWGD